jgi:hypothetical protein
MSGFGSFSQEAYEQLQAAYAAQLAEADAVESAGVKIGSDTLGVETAPFKADWLDKTGLWKYPDGKGDYIDRKQSPEDLLAALRNAEGEVEMPAAEDDSEDTDLSDLSDEELNSMVDDILGEIEAEEETGEEMTDEELDSFIDSLLAGVDPDEIENMTDEELDAFLAAALEGDEEEEEDREDRDFNTEGMSDMIGEEENGDDAISIAEKIAALKEELAMLSSSLETEEEPEADVEEEPETTEAVEETDSDEQEEPVEEETSDDEPA